MQNQTGSTSNHYLYTGQQYDASTELYSLRARYYSPGIGRFFSQDTFGVNFSNPIELNRYGYAANNPVNASDPSGNQAFFEYSISSMEDLAEISAGYAAISTGIGTGAVYLYLLALNTPWIVTGLFVIGAGTEGFLLYRAVFLGDQEAAFALATGYQLINYSGSALVYLAQISQRGIVQAYTAYRYLNAISRAINISRLMVGKTPEELERLIVSNNWASPQRAFYRTTDQWKTFEFLNNGFKIEIRVHEGLLKKGEFGWLGRVSLNAGSLDFFPEEIRYLVAEPGQFSQDYQLYVDPLIGGPVPAQGSPGHFPLSDLITYINGRAWFERIFEHIFGQ